jgi:hypothetical protein
VATAATVADAPFLGATSSEPLLGASVAPTVAPTTVPETSLLGEATSTTVPTTASGVVPETSLLSEPTSTALPGATAPEPTSYGLLDQVGDWWDTTSVGDKLKAGGTLLSGASAAKGAATPAPSKGPTHTIQPGQVGRPQGGEQQLAAIVDAMLKKRDAYQQGQLGGAPIAYRPRGLLG